MAARVPTTVNMGSLGGTTATTGGVQGGIDVLKQTASDMGGGLLDSLKGGMTWAEKNPRLTQAGAGILQAGLGAYGQQQAAIEQQRMIEDAQARARQRLSDSVRSVRAPTYKPGN